MAIVQEDRADFIQPEVNDTEYGAQYVTAATETPAESVEPSAAAEEAPVVEKKKGRPRKSDKK